MDSRASKWLSGKEFARQSGTSVRSLGQEHSLGKEMTTHSSMLALVVPWTEEPGGLQSLGLKKSQTQLSD